jgi:hypothetical protein
MCDDGNLPLLLRINFIDMISQCQSNQFVILTEKHQND